MHHTLNPSPTQYSLGVFSAYGRCLRVALRHALYLLMPALLAVGDESAMNLEGLGGSFSTHLSFFRNIFARCTGPVLWALAYGGAINTYRRYYLFLMYDERAPHFVHKNTLSMGPGLRGEA